MSAKSIPLTAAKGIIPDPVRAGLARGWKIVDAASSTPTARWRPTSSSSAAAPAAA
jgi:hypothetical protein